MRQAGHKISCYFVARPCILGGEVSIDNNTAERGIRPITVGRKNYLFFGSDIRWKNRIDPVQRDHVSETPWYRPLGVSAKRVFANPGDESIRIARTAARPLENQLT